MDMLSAENISSDVFHGCFVVTCTLFAFIGLVWLREQILHAGGPDWLGRDIAQVRAGRNPAHLHIPEQQLQGQRALQQQEIQDNNNVPPFVDEPPVLLANPNNDNPRNVEGHRIEDNNLVNNERTHETEGHGRDIELHAGARNGEQQIDQLPREMEPAVAPRDIEPVVPRREMEPAIAPRDIEPVIPHRDMEVQVDGEQANARVGEGWRDQVQGQAQGEAEEANWNPLEWDRPAEELTWDRLLGLDGSLVFLEHVFWVVSLNTLFIMVLIYA